MKSIALLAISAVWLAEGSFAVPATEPAGAQARAAVPLFGASQFDLASKISART